MWPFNSNSETEDEDYYIVSPYEVFNDRNEEVMDQSDWPTCAICYDPLSVTKSLESSQVGNWLRTHGSSFLADRFDSWWGRIDICDPYTTECKHVVGQKCLYDWTKLVATCPVCSSDIKTPPSPSLPCRASPTAEQLERLAARIPPWAYWAARAVLAFVGLFLAYAVFTLFVIVAYETTDIWMPLIVVPLSTLYETAMLSVYTALYLTGFWVGIVQVLIEAVGLMLNTLLEQVVRAGWAKGF